MDPKKEYYKFIDTAKGLGIIFIVAGHIIPNSDIFRMIYAFHIPLFFILSGFTYRLKPDKKRFYQGKAARLLIPYYAFALISIAIYYVMSKVISLAGDSRILPNLLGMLYGNTNTKYMTWNRPLWFLPCLFCALILLDMIETLMHKYRRENSAGLRLAVIAILWTFGILINTVIKGLYLPFQLESAIFLVGFSELGVLLAKWVHQTPIKKPQSFRGCVIACVCLSGLFILGTVLSSINGLTDIRPHLFGKHPVLLIITSLIFSGVTIYIASLLENNRLLAYLGSSSLSILLMHKFPILFFQEIMPYVRDLLAARDTLAGTVCGIFACGIVILMCLVAERILLMICPQILGKTSPRKQG